jgi:hypothetical protein
MVIMVDLPRRELPVSLRTSLQVWLPVVLAGGIGVAIGVIGGLHGGRLLLAVVGAVAIVLGAVAVLRPPRLVLDADALALRTPLGLRWQQRWTDCGDFRTWRGDVVVWASPGEAARYPRRAATWRKRADADTGMVAHFGALSATDLATLLNRYRTAASHQNPA